MTDHLSETPPTKTVALVLETDLDAPIETVWRALTDPALVAQWLLPNDLVAEPGHDFKRAAAAEQGGGIDCTVIESVPPHRLAYLWRLPAGEGREPSETVVSFDLAAWPDGGTHLRLVHDGFTVPAEHAVDRVADETVLVLLPVIARRRIRRPRARILVRGGAMPLVMRLAA